MRDRKWMCLATVVLLALAVAVPAGAGQSGPGKAAVYELIRHLADQNGLDPDTVRRAIKRIENEACENYWRSGELKMVTQVSDPQPGDIRTINFGYVCDKDRNGDGRIDVSIADFKKSGLPALGWIRDPSKGAEDEDTKRAINPIVLGKGSMPGVTRLAIPDNVYFRNYPYKRTIFPARLPSNPDEPYPFWRYDGDINPLAPQIKVAVDSPCDPADCGKRQIHETTLNGRKICFWYKGDSARIRWEGPYSYSTVWEENDAELQAVATVPVSWPAVVDRNPAELREQPWEYRTVGKTSR